MCSVCAVGEAKGGPPIDVQLSVENLSNHRFWEARVCVSVWGYVVGVL